MIHNRFPFIVIVENQQESGNGIALTQTATLVDNDSYDEAEWRIRHMSSTQSLKDVKVLRLYPANYNVKPAL